MAKVTLAKLLKIKNRHASALTRIGAQIRQYNRYITVDGLGKPEVDMNQLLEEVNYQGLKHLGLLQDQPSVDRAIG